MLGNVLKILFVRMIDSYIFLKLVHANYPITCYSMFLLENFFFMLLVYFYHGQDDAIYDYCYHNDIFFDTQKTCSDASGLSLPHDGR